MIYPENSYSYKIKGHDYASIMLNLPNGSRLYHCETGPAIIFDNGVKLWWFWNDSYGASNEGYTQELFEKYIKLRVFR